MPRLKTKICCMISPAEITMATEAGAELVGLVGPMPTGPGTLTLAEAAALARATPAGVTSVLLTASSTLADLSEELTQVRPGAVQLVRHVAPALYRELAQAWPEIQRLQVIHVEGPEAVDLIHSYGPGPDAFLLDSGRVASDELGGTGRVHDWSISRACVEAAAQPVFLAGGLTPANIADAIARVRPQGIDVCSGLRSGGKLDQVKLTAFMAAIREAA